ncbi:MAG: hypothetical protein K2I36_01375 [Ureaplasma sp.]|nr:hypothetical protein [Ureaplasma sp.]
MDSKIKIKKISLAIITILAWLTLLTSIIICSIYLQASIDKYIPKDIHNIYTIHVLGFGCSVGVSGFLFLILNFNLLSFLSQNKKLIIDEMKNIFRIRAKNDR